jgi:hypothetical protein
MYLWYHEILEIKRKHCVCVIVFCIDFVCRCLMGASNEHCFVHLVELESNKTNRLHMWPFEQLLKSCRRIRTMHCFIFQLCCLSLHSTHQQSMRVVTVRERFYFINRTPYDLDVCCGCALLSRVKVTTDCLIISQTIVIMN